MERATQALGRVAADTATMLRTFCLREASLTAKAVCMVLIVAFVVTGCASSTLIRSVPPGAKVYVDGQYLGQSPVTHRDSAPLWTTKTVTLKLDGYGDQSGTIRKENLRVGPLIGCNPRLRTVSLANGLP